ncbi:MAG TPA: FxsA family protein [Hyphomicrobium sp.]|nr:FxsA family protein [Hyphomicrobium sp.]
MVHPIRLASVLAFLAFPILEIGLLIRVGQLLGFWKLALFVIATALLGSAVIRRTGFAVLTKARQQIDSGERGFNPLLDGLLQITAGLLLIFPGLISDVLGLILLVPAIRSALIVHVLPRFFAVSTYTETDETFSTTGHSASDSAPHGPFDASMDDGVTIEGEYERVSESKVAGARSVATKPLRRSAK